MFLRRAYHRWPEFAEGARDQLSVGFGIAAWALMTGVAMVQGGLGSVEAVGMTLLVYAGSAQLTAVPLMVSGAPVWVVLAAAFCVNLRFVVFSAHLRPYVAHLPRHARLLTGYVTGDLSYVFFVKRYAQPGETPQALERQQAYLMGNCAVNYAIWMSSCLLGVAVAHALPVHWGLGFAGILALLGVGCSLVTTRLRALAAVVAGCAAVVAWTLPLRLNIVVAIASAVAVCSVAQAYGTDTKGRQ